MPGIAPRTEPHTSDGMGPKKDFFDKHPIYFYSIGGGILLVVLLICIYFLWRGPQRSYWPDMCTRRRRKEATGGGGGGPVPTGSEGVWGAEQGPGVSGGGGKWRKTVYLTDLKRGTNMLQKPRPGGGAEAGLVGGVGATGGASTSSLGTGGGSGTEVRGGVGRRKQGSWTGTVSSFGHSASMLMSFGPGSLTTPVQGQAQAPGYPPMQRASSESYRGPAAPGGSVPSLEALREDSPEMFYTPRGRMEGQAWQSTPRLPPPSGASSYSSVGEWPTSWATPGHSPYTPPPMGQGSPHTPGWDPSPLGGGPPPPSVGLATTPPPQGWGQPAPGPAGGIQAPTPVYARPRSAAPPSVPSPLGTPPAGPPGMPGMPATPRTALPPIIADELGAAPPRLSPRVQFSPLPMPTANSSTHSLPALAAQASTSAPVAGATPTGSRGSGEVVLGTRSRSGGGSFGYAI